MFCNRSECYSPGIITQPTFKLKVSTAFVVANTTQKAKCQEDNVNGNKWTLKNLPDDNTRKLFLTHFVPALSTFMSFQEAWAAIEVNELQVLVDQVYGEDVYDVMDTPAWMKLVSLFYVYQL